MKVIGAGFGRTGTSSLQTALEILGFGPCYHMNQVLRKKGDISTKIFWRVGVQVGEYLFQVVKEPGSYERAEQWAEVLEQSDGKRAMELMKGQVPLFFQIIDLKIFRGSESALVLGTKNSAFSAQFLA